jgi:hypothetical protein
MRMMHQLLRPRFPIKLAALSAALWCAGMAAAVLAHVFQNNAPAPAAADVLEPFTVMIRSVPIIPELAFDDRWQGPGPAMQHVRMAEEAEISSDQAKPSHNSAKHVARHADTVCGTRGRRYFHIGRRLSWRCRR